MNKKQLKQAITACFWIKKVHRIATPFSLFFSLHPLIFNGIYKVFGRILNLFLTLDLKGRVVNT
jgi:hypothetical protein